MKISEITAAIEQVAPVSLQEGFDNTGFQAGDPEATATGALLCTDITPAVVDEAVERGYNLVISHHPIIFHPLKKLIGATVPQRVVMQALRADVTLYCAHTNMDNAMGGVSFRMARKLGMTDVDFLQPTQRDDAPGGRAGCGVIGNVEAMPALDVLRRAKDAFQVGSVKYSGDGGKIVTRVALCGGAGAFLIPAAIRAGAQLMITADARHNDFIDNNRDIIVADIGHFESEQYTKEIFFEVIRQKFRTFAVDFAKSDINQIKYL